MTNCKQTVKYKEGYIHYGNEDGKIHAVIEDIQNESFNTTLAAKRWITNKSEALYYTPRYNPSHPKLDIYVKGIYRVSTNYYRTCFLCKTFSTEKYGHDIKVIKSK